ncbi:MULTISPECIES: hypothetical protein [Actinosynnema]|uniref:hypothetical protein n=1 Tax=Actinosynnema TaxID=40566 RepID=UPI0020A394DB|nr:hypothetical protein [Actinosynnema pretiosum]MCP2096542.1 hypothetical protein [Actinosynnema pretiosum]
MGTGDYESIRDAVISGIEDGDATRVLDALVSLRELREELAQWEPELIAAARDAGISWAELALALGLASRQAAERRYLRLREAGPDSTAEGRVRAERDRRASERAVAKWARTNSVELRDLASQAGQFDMVVRHALITYDDTAELLPPLLAAQEAVRDQDPTLATEIQRMEELSEEVRREVQAARDAKS